MYSSLISLALTRRPYTTLELIEHYSGPSNNRPALYRLMVKPRRYTIPRRTPLLNVAALRRLLRSNRGRSTRARTSPPQFSWTISGAKMWFDYRYAWLSSKQSIRLGSLTGYIAFALGITVFVSSDPAKQTLPKVKAIESTLVNMKSDVAVMKSDVAGMKSDVAAMRTDVAAMRTDVATISGEVTKTREGTWYFYAYCTGGFTVGLLVATAYFKR